MFEENKELVKHMRSSISSVVGAGRVLLNHDGLFSP